MAVNTQPGRRLQALGFSWNDHLGREVLTTHVVFFVTDGNFAQASQGTTSWLPFRAVGDAGKADPSIFTSDPHPLIRTRHLDLPEPVNA